MIEGKGLGGKRPNRLGLSLSNKEEADLQKLATACNFKYTAALAHEILTRCMYDGLFITQLQNEFCTQRAYRIVLINGEYVLTGRDDL